MKKIVFFSLLASLFVLFHSCRKEDDKVAETIVNIKVQDISGAKQGVTVYMFKKDRGPGTTFFKPFFADKTVVTESNGVATFKLQEVYDLEVINHQSTLYFGVFNNNTPKGHVGVTIEKGQTKSATINLQ